MDAERKNQISEFVYMFQHEIDDEIQQRLTANLSGRSGHYIQDSMRDYWIASVRYINNQKLAARYGVKLKVL